MRTIVEIPEEQLRLLAAVCRREKISRAEAIRRAVVEYARHRAAAGARNAFGIWRGRSLDGLAYQRRLRRAW
jgi:metal-responsive CopG/Arc/MetJ family transcriptional regulator